MINSRFRKTVLVVIAFVMAMPFSSRAQTATDRGAFVIVQRGDTAAIERFVRTPDSIAVELAIKMQGRFVYVAHITPDLSIDRMTIQYFMPNAPADAPPAQTALLTEKGDSVIAEVGSGAQKQTQRLKTTTGAVMLPPASLTAAEQLMMKMRRAGHALSVPVFMTSGGVTTTASLAPVGSDSAVMTLTNESRFNIDQTGRILGGVSAAGAVTVSRVSGEAAAKLTLGKPDYSAPADAPYTAEEVRLPGPGGTTLGGTLTLPRNPVSSVPAVITITGSGQEDRDEYIPVAGGYRPFRQIADTLSRRGIAVLRLDDRGIGGSNGNPTTSTSADFADDIRSAVTYLRSRREIDPSRVALLGHSEGALIAPMVAATDNRVKAIVLLAGPADNGRQIIEYQQRYAIDRDTAITASNRASKYKAAQVALDSVAAKNPWIKFFLDYAPDATARKVRAPVLILQGATDQQVPAGQSEKLAAAFRAGGNRDVTVHVFPGLNHLFITDPEGNPAEYARLTTNKMNEEVLGALADWLVAKLKPGT